MIKEHITKIQQGESSAAELALTGICLVLSGIILGMKLAPARFLTLGSFNGNSGCIDKPEDIKELFKKDKKMTPGKALPGVKHILQSPKRNHLSLGIL